MFSGLLNIRDNNDNAADDVNENWKENYLLFLSIYIGKGNEIQKISFSAISSPFAMRIFIVFLMRSDSTLSENLFLFHAFEISITHQNSEAYDVGWHQM